MMQSKRLAGVARIIGLLVTLALLLGLLLPLAGVGAQEATDGPTVEALAEVPSYGARRPGPVILYSGRVRAPAPQGFAPVELVVDKIGLDAPIEQGTIADGVMLDPSGPWVVSWYSQLSDMGEGGNVVMAGHVDYWDTGPAIFQGVPSLVPGDVISVIGENGETYQYAVEWAQLFDVATQLTPEVIQHDIVGNTGQESLTLITCGGEFDASRGEYLHRFIVRANKI
jgi:sortase (surface protein transpeptidase)